MLIRKFTLALLLAAFVAPAAFADDAPAAPPAGGKGKVSQNPDALAIDKACAAEAQTAGCGAEKVGTGMLRCLHTYRKEHRKDFKVSEGCKAALQKARASRKARKAKKEAQ
jgi:hypothetical protein